MEGRPALPLQPCIYERNSSIELCNVLYPCRKDPEHGVHVGFTFSFPVEQTAIDEGTILYMTKKFQNKGANGADPIALLQDACKKHGGEVSPPLQCMPVI